MSLTSFLELKDVKKKFRESFPKPWFTLKKEILAPPLTNHYALVGTAFDYLIRFLLKRVNPKAITHRWVAENVPECINELGVIFNDPERANKFRAIVEGIIAKAKLNYSEYLKTGKMNKKIIESALLLSQIDPIYRAGFVDENLGTVDKKDIADLKNIISKVNTAQFKAKKLCVLNPTFGKASHLVGGADTDLILDNMLIDFKTTKNLEFTRDFFNQLVGYYILYKIGGISGLKYKPKIDIIGVYYSRFALLHTISIKELVQINLLPFIKWFKRRANKEFHLLRRK